jgi:hypothetical protein
MEEKAVTPMSAGGGLSNVRIAVAPGPDEKTVRFILDVPREPQNLGRLDSIVNGVKSKTSAIADVRIMVRNREAPPA